MCNSTKQKIASTMHEMMSRKPFEKITVKNLMDVSNMNRQSFYYHFRDTRDVLSWICQERIFRPLAASELEFSEWIIYGLELLDRDQSRQGFAVTHLGLIGHAKALAAHA